MNYLIAMELFIAGFIVVGILFINHYLLKNHDHRVQKIKIAVYLDGSSDRESCDDQFIVKDWYIDEEGELWMEDHDGRSRVIANGKWTRVDELEKSWYKPSDG